MAEVDGYAPEVAPSQNSDETKALAKWVERELGRVAAIFQGQAILRLQVIYVAPPKPRDGMVVFADGTHWNPGSGAGPYARVSGSWVKLFP